MAECSAKQLGLSQADLPNSVIEVIATLSKSGFEAYLVGGGVRDTLLGLNPKDFDAVTNAKPHEIKDIFGKRCRIIGRRFQLAHVYSGRDMIEVATFRAPPKGDTHTNNGGMIVRDNVWGDIEQDFARRDFTINALYYQPIKGVVHDFCNALGDIESKTLKLLGQAPIRIEEDPVRLLRALRFKAKLGFDFDNALSKQFNDNNWRLLEQVSPHRLYDESQKMFTGGYLVPLLPLLFEYGAIDNLIIYPPKAPTRLVNQVAINTDKRIELGKSINPAFFYAALLWDNYLYQLAKFKKKNNMPFQDAQIQASTKVIARQRLKTAIPRFAEQFIRDIWVIQPKLANPRAKQIYQLADHPRFRAAYDFLLLREQCDDAANPLSESTNGMGAWWQTFQTLSDKQKQQMIEEFNINENRASRRGRKRNQQPDQVTHMQHPDLDNCITDNALIDAPATATHTPVTSELLSTGSHPEEGLTKDPRPIPPQRRRKQTISRPQRAHYAKERAQLQKLSLAQRTGASGNEQPKPLFTISAEKLLKQLPQAPIAQTVDQSSQQSANLTDEQTKPCKSASKHNKQQHPKGNADNDTSKKDNTKTGIEAKSDIQSPINSRVAQPSNNLSDELTGTKSSGIVSKSKPVPNQRRRRQPSSHITQIERMHPQTGESADKSIPSKKSCDKPDKLDAFNVKDSRVKDSRVKDSGVEDIKKTMQNAAEKPPKSHHSSLTNQDKKTTLKNSAQKNSAQKNSAQKADMGHSTNGKTDPNTASVPNKTTDPILDYLMTKSERAPANRRRRQPSSTVTVKEKMHSKSGS